MEARPVTAPLGSLDHLATRCTTSFPALLAARQRSESGLNQLARELAGVPLPAGTSVVLLGSWGRAEGTGVSDLDWLLVDANPKRAPIGSSEPIPMAQLALDPTFAETPVAAHL